MKLIALLALLLIPSLAHAWCQTVVVPESEGTGAAVHVGPGSNYLVQYYHPPAAASVTLEFWSHAFPGTANSASQYLLAYLNNPGQGARRVFHAWNTGPEYDSGWASNFAMGMRMHPGEWFVVNWLNNLTVDVDGYLAVTIEECYP